MMNFSIADRYLRIPLMQAANQAFLSKAVELWREIKLQLRAFLGIKPTPYFCGRGRVGLGTTLFSNVFLVLFTIYQKKKKEKKRLVHNLSKRDTSLQLAILLEIVMFHLSKFTR